MSRPEQKRCKITPSGNDKSGPTCNNVENRAQAEPIDSFSRCSNSRIALGRGPIRDMGKNVRKKLPLSSSQSPFALPTTNMYHCFAFPVREKGNNFHLMVSCVMPKMYRHGHISSKSSRCWHGFSFSCPKKGNARIVAISHGWSSYPNERFGFGESGGSWNSPFEVEGFEFVVGFMFGKI
jgi:hypothetical protein